MKYSIFALLLICSACREESSLEKSVSKLEISHARLDSAIYYFTKQIDYAMKRDSNEIAYLETGNEKYRHRGNECVHIAHEHYLHLKRVTDKKQ